MTVAGIEIVLDRECARDAGADVVLFLAAAASPTKSLVLADRGLSPAASRAGTLAFRFTTPEEAALAGATVLGFGANLDAVF